MSKLKGFADNKSNATQNLKFVLGRVQNIVGKEENAGCQHFLLFLLCFQKPSFSGSLKLQAFADDKSNVTQNLKFVLGRVENIVGKGENAGYQHFLLILQCFQKPSFSGSLKFGIVW